MKNNRNLPQLAVSGNGVSLENIRLTSDYVLKEIGLLHQFKYPELEAFLHRAVKKIINKVSTNFANIFNTSVETGTLSVVWRKAKISLIFEKRALDNFQNMSQSA